MACACFQVEELEGEAFLLPSLPSSSYPSFLFLFLSFFFSGRGGIETLSWLCVAQVGFVPLIPCFCFQSTGMLTCAIPGLESETF